jgi:hypothetical protein
MTFRRLDSVSVFRWNLTQMGSIKRSSLSLDHHMCGDSRRGNVNSLWWLVLCCLYKMIGVTGGVRRQRLVLSTALTWKSPPGDRDRVQSPKRRVLNKGRMMDNLQGCDSYTIYVLFFLVFSFLNDFLYSVLFYMCHVPLEFHQPNNIRWTDKLRNASISTIPLSLHPSCLQIFLSASTSQKPTIFVHCVGLNFI